MKLVFMYEICATIFKFETDLFNPKSGRKWVLSVAYAFHDGELFCDPSKAIVQERIGGNAFR